jgi:hypothetical protein
MSQLTMQVIHFWMNNFDFLSNSKLNNIKYLNEIEWK